MCTGVRFSDKDGNMFMGRNLDWSFDYGEQVEITPADFQYKSEFLGEIKPQHGGIIGMAIRTNSRAGQDIPLYFDCYNEAGLGVAGLNFPGYAKYEEKPVDGKTNVAAYEFPFWVAMNFDSVDEAEKALRDVAIVAQPVSDQYPVSMLHYLIGDAKRSIVVEYTENGMEIYDNPVDILTNQPGYKWHQENLRNYMNLFPTYPNFVMWEEQRIEPFGSGSLMRGLPGDYSAPSRFVRSAYLNTHYPVQEGEEANVSRLFHTLLGTMMIDGAAEMSDKKCEKTLYTGGYSAATKTYYYNTYDDMSIKAVKLG